MTTSTAGWAAVVASGVAALGLQAESTTNNKTNSTSKYLFGFIAFSFDRLDLHLGMGAPVECV
jgi:hypothetical protein